MKSFKYLYFLSILFLLSCECKEDRRSTADLNAVYNDAIQDANKMEPGEFYDSIKVLKDDSVVMLTWISKEYLEGYKKSWSSGKPMDVKGFDMWVTAVPDLKDFCLAQKINDTDSATLRLKQLLGLPLTNANQYFVELQVDKDDLYRPAPDTSVISAMFLPDDSVRGSEAYQKWYKGKLTSSYADEDKFPWTRLGYTYDWGNAYSEIGLSEFVIPGSIDPAQVRVVGIYSTEQYCVLN